MKKDYGFTCHFCGTKFVIRAHRAEIARMTGYACCSKAECNTALSEQLRRDILAYPPEESEQAVC